MSAVSRAAFRLPAPVGATMGLAPPREGTAMSVACSLASLLATFHMPGEVWGALIAIGGVLLASRLSRKEAARQRQFEMRRTVYLEGAEVIARANMVLGRMSDLDLPN